MGKGQRAGTRRSDEWGFLPTDRGQVQKCFECGIDTTGRHHVVPVSVGGTKQIPLCTACHELVHGCELFHANTIRTGLEKARARGVILGAPVKATDEIKAKAVEMRRQGMTHKKIAKELNISVGTAFKAAKQ